MRSFVFLIGIIVVIYNLRKNPAWAAAAAGYFYFAIPMREYYAPSAPYQAGFFFVATMLAGQTRSLAREMSEADIAEHSLRSVRSIVTRCRALAVELLTRLAMERTPTRETQAKSVEEVDKLIEKLAPECTPPKLLGIVTEASQEVCHRSIEQVCVEAERILEADDALRAKAAPGAVQANVKKQSEAIFSTESERLIEPVVQSELAKTITAYEVSKAEAPNEMLERGVLGVPLHRPAIVAILTNFGIWGHLLFTFVVIIESSRAQWSVAAAEAQIAVCWLLFIPLIGIIAGIRNANQLRLFFWAWVLGVAHLCTNGIQIWLKHGGRADYIGGQGEDANFLGIIAVSVAPVALSIFIAEKRRWIAWPGLGLAGICALGLLASGSRGGLIAGCIGVAYWFFWTNRKGIATALVLVGLAGFLSVAPSSFWERMSTVLLPKVSNPWVVVNYEESAQSRKRAWKLATALFKQNPMFGIGPRNFPLANRELANEVIETHSTWFQLLAEQGLLGIVAWVGTYILSFIWMFRAFLIARRLRNDERFGWLSTYLLGVQGGWISNTIAISFVSTQWYDYNFWYFIVGPLAFQIAKETRAYVQWFDAVGPQPAQVPPPRYGSPTRSGLDLDSIRLGGTPTLPVSIEEESERRRGEEGREIDPA